MLVDDPADPNFQPGLWPKIELLCLNLTTKIQIYEFRKEKMILIINSSIGDRQSENNLNESIVGLNDADDE